MKNIKNMYEINDYVRTMLNVCLETAKLEERMLSISNAINDVIICCKLSHGKYIVKVGSCYKDEIAYNEYKTTTYFTDDYYGDTLIDALSNAVKGYMTECLTCIKNTVSNAR